MSETNWGASHTHYYSSGIGSAYWDYGPGTIPYFIIIGPQNELYYSSNSVYGIPNSLQDAIDNFALFSAFSSNVIQGPPTLGVQFTSNASSPDGDILTWEWDLDGDGTIDSNEENPHYEYTEIGTYAVTLTVTDINNSADLTKTEYITVTDPANVSGSVAGIWSTDYSPYHITEDLIIAQGSTLDIESGTEIMVNNETLIEINGLLVADGAGGEKITFTAEESWSGLLFDGNEQDALIRNCEISNVEGAAITLMNDANLDIMESWIIDNSSTGNHGVAFDITASDDVLIQRNVIANNTSSNLTGGINTLGSSPTITNNLIVNNGSATALAGAFSFKSGSAPTVINNTLANNQASSCEIFCFNSPNTIIMNSIIYHEGNITNAIGGYPSITYSSVSGGTTGEGNIDVDPMFMSPSTGIGPDFNGYNAYWQLAEESLCIDAGNPDEAYNDLDGTQNDMGAFGGAGFYEYVGSEDEEIVPQKISAISVYPNPFNPETNIELQLTETDLNYPVSLAIYNIKGQKVKTLVNNEIITTQISFNWNGNDDNGNNAASGIYFVQLNTANAAASQKVILLK